MTIRPDVAELLKAGHPDRTIARHLHMDHKTVSKARALLGLPKAKQGPKAAATAADLFWNRTQPTDDGHLLWTGHVSASGCPSLRHGGKHHTAYRVAFGIRFGRAPEGKVTPTCDRPLCVSPHHVEDRLIRERTQDTFAAIFGGTA
jgi:hypothetical protein